MTTKIYEADAADLDGSDEQFSTDISSKDKRFTVLYANDLDAEITVSAKLTRKNDIALDDGVAANTQKIASDDAGSDVLLEGPWGRIGAVVSFDSEPSSGRLTVYLIMNPR